MSIAGLSRVSLVSALNANPSTVITLPSSVLNSSDTMLRGRRHTKAGEEGDGQSWSTFLKNAAFARRSCG
jgi:hypothetical protein